MQLNWLASVLAVALVSVAAASKQNEEVIEVSETVHNTFHRQYEVAQRQPASRTPSNPFETFFTKPWGEYTPVSTQYKTYHPDARPAVNQYRVVTDSAQTNRNKANWNQHAKLAQPYRSEDTSDKYRRPHDGHQQYKPALAHDYATDFYTERHPPVTLKKPSPYAQPEWKPYQPPASYQYKCPNVYNLETVCRPAKDCSVWYDVVANTPGTECKLADGSPAMCCPDLPYNGRGSALRSAKKEVKLYRNIDLYSLNAAAKAGLFSLDQMDNTGKFLKANNMTVRKGSSEYSHLQFFKSTEAAQERGQAAFAAVETAKELALRFELSPDEAAFGLSELSLRDTILENACPVDPDCGKLVHHPFRTIDGSCNNLRHPSWGQARSQMQRILPPRYADGIWQTRDSGSGFYLPRLVSISVVPDIDAPSDTNTLWVMQYGQFIDHDFTSTPVFRLANNTGIKCCTDDGQFIRDPELIHPGCMPIEIPSDDPFFSKFKQRCMNFVRSAPSPRYDCRLGHAEQMDQHTHFLDNSHVYGSTAEEAEAVRVFKNGALKVTPPKGHHEMPLLPPDLNPEDPTEDCKLSKKITGKEPPADVKCFKAGDFRVNQLPHLAINHIVFMRQHNRLSAQLAELNPHWDDERIFQESRRILTAQMQHVTYNEWLPVVIGRDKMQQLGLLPLAYGFSTDYDDYLNPSLLNEFAAAAFRFGHSLIQGTNQLINHKRAKESEIILRQHFNKIQLVYTPGNVDKFLIGLSTQPIQNMDSYFTKEVTNHLFEELGKGFGLDLVSLNLQRGRDHGLQGYNAYRTLCGLPRAKYFRDLLDVIPAAIVERFELLYESVDDIDLYIGAVSERPAPGALIGPTIQCIVADQFLRFKRADRFFYDLAGQAGSFTERQLDEIRKTSFARLICDNSRVHAIQPLAFKIESLTNPVVRCDSAAIPQMSLQPWQESVKPIANYQEKKSPHGPTHYRNHQIHH